MNKFHIQGWLQQAGGMATASTGRLLGNVPLQRQGKTYQVLGKALMHHGDRVEVVREITAARY
jgi:hypothetical protein